MYIFISFCRICLCLEYVLNMSWISPGYRLDIAWISPEYLLNGWIFRSTYKSNNFWTPAYFDTIFEQHVDVHFAYTRFKFHANPLKNELDTSNRSERPFRAVYFLWECEKKVPTTWKKGPKNMPKTFDFRDFARFCGRCGVARLF